jgi:uncharacterized protein
MNMPQIWFNKRTQLYNDLLNLDNNCDCACPTTATVSHTNATVVNLQGQFRQTTPVHLQELSERLWLACNPTLEGHIAILDEAAADLLHLFATPRTIAELGQAQSSLSRQVIESMVTQLIHLELLEDAEMVRPVHHWERSDVLSVWLHVTNECNLRCPYCYLEKTPEDMSENVAVQSVDAVFRSAVQHGFRRVKLKYAGGEASLQMGHVLTIHDYAARVAAEKGVELESVILSNGVALSARMIQELSKRDIRVMISLDGLEEYHDIQRPFVNGHGSFKHVERSIERLVTGGVVPSISVTVSNHNLEGLPTLVDYLLTRKLPFNLNYYRENECSASRTDLQYQETQMIDTMRMVFGIIEHNLPRYSLLNALVDRSNLSTSHSHTCGVGDSYMVIDQHGNIAKCQMEIGHTITNIHVADPLLKIIQDRDGIQNIPVDEKEGCRTCEWRYWCTGGCALLTYRATGRYDVKSPNCNIYQALYPAVLRLEGLRLLKYGTPWQASEQPIVL